MNKIVTSIVGKLWITILLLVSFILSIFALFMLQFLNALNNEQAEDTLWQTAESISKVVKVTKDENEQMEILDALLGKHMNAIIAEDSGKVIYADQVGINAEAIQQTILSNDKLQAVLRTDESVLKELTMPSHVNEGQQDEYVVLGFPLNTIGDHDRTIFIYKNPEAIFQTTNQTSKSVLVAALIALITTTIFAFFLSNKITLPLRKMREHAFELSKGKFDSKLPKMQNDEIGQLAVAFNQMARQLKQHVEVINQEKEQLASILTSMTDSVLTFNRDHTLLVSNPPAEKLLQKWYSENIVQSGQPIPAALDHMLNHVMDFEDQLSEDLQIGHSYYNISITPLYSKESVRGAVVIIRDMTEQKKLDKLRSDFIANVSHELRTPIAMLQGYSEAILDDIVVDEEEQKEIIRIIYDESQRMGRLVSDLLDLARMESGNITLYKAPIQVAPSIERMTHKFAQAAKEKQVHLYFDSHVNERLTLNVDEDRMEQVLTNLIDNAIRHTPEQQSVKVSVEEELSFVKIQVRDTGVGIPEDDLPYVFERFYKADKARTRSKGGTGLGLAIAKNIMIAHQGHITVESKVDEGTTFTIFLPLFTE